jgi:hypothetical protein
VTIGIGINIDTQPIKSARREVDFLNKSLKETENIDLAPGGKEGAQDYSEMVKRLAEDIRRLKAISASGDRQGGLLNKHQFAEAEKISKRVGENFQAYTKDLSRARDELSKLVRERESLEKIGRSGAYESVDAFTRRQERLGVLRGQTESRESELASLSKHEGRMGTLHGRAGEAGEAISGFGAMAGGGASLKKALGVGAALLGGMTAMGFLNDAMAKAVAFGGGDADLARRGGGVGNRSSYGFTPIEALQISDSLNRSTGLRGADLDRSSEMVKMFARGQGLSDSTVSGYMGGIHQATGLTAPLFERHLERLRAAVEKGGIGGRSEEFLRLNQQILGRISQGVGGEMSERELKWVTSLQSGLWSMPGMAGKGDMGADLLSRLDQGIRGGGGTPGQQLFLYRALQGDGVHNIDDYYKLVSRREKGIADPENLRDIYNLASSTYGTDKNGRMSTVGKLSVMSMFGLNTRQANMFADMGAGGMFDERSMRRFLESGGSGKEDADAAMGLPGNVHRQVVADIEELKTIIGEGVLPAVDQLKGGLAGASKALFDFAAMLGTDQTPLSTLDPGMAGPQLSPDDPRYKEMYGYQNSKTYRWSRNLVRGTLRSMKGEPPEYEGGPDAPLSNLADQIGQKIEEVMERQANRVQRVEVVNAPTPMNPSRTAGSGK